MSAGGTQLMLLALSVLYSDSHVYFVGIQTNSLIAWLMVGLIAGWIAGTVTRGRGFGCIVNVILGLVGAVIGGWIFTKLGIPAWGFLGSLAAAIVGAVLLVAIARLFAGSRD